jgi:hypothetical protein
MQYYQEILTHNRISITVIEYSNGRSGSIRCTTENFEAEEFDGHNDIG